MSTDSFIARWARLKAESAAPAPTPPVPERLERQPETPVEAPPLSAEEIAALPALDTLTAGSDIAPYLRKGVPALLRQGALRRMWTLNPAIRDYVDDAMEYAMDWNTPGAILGNGPLNVGDDAASMVRRLVGGRAEDQGARAEGTQPAGTQDDAARPDAARPDAAQTQTAEAQTIKAQTAGAQSAQPQEPSQEPPREDAAPDAAPLAPPARRRHGGAAPT